MKYQIKTQDLGKRKTTLNANKLIKDKNKNLLIFYYDDDIICTIKTIDDDETDTR